VAASWCRALRACTCEAGRCRRRLHARARTRRGAHEARRGAQTFHSRNGKAYLFQAVALINIIFGAQEERVMTTGRPGRPRLAVLCGRPCFCCGCR